MTTATLIRPEFTKFGPKHDYRGAHVQMRTPLGRVLLGEIVDVYRDDVRGISLAKVRHFCGDMWPLEPALSALLLLDRSAKTPGQIDYESSLANEPDYHDGTPRKQWHELDAVAQWSWERDATTP